jgi:GMP synthase (glutamine-hydrolysing)
MQKVLILQQSPDTPVGSTQTWLDRNGYAAVHLKVWEIQTWPELNSYDWLVLCGGGPNVDEEDQWPWMRAEKAFLKEAIAADKKILGLCLGAQLIAEQLGAKVHRHEHSEVGWFEVSVNNRHPLFQFSNEKLLVFQYHSYRFHLPKNAEKIAWNEITSDQAFVFGQKIVAFQFHPESTSQWVEDCATDVKDPLPKGPYCQDASTILQFNKSQQEPLQQWYFQFLNLFSKI